MTDKEQLAWSSYGPVLIACVVATTGPVLELGIGNFSTPMLHALCGTMKRELVSVEKDAEWLAKFTFLERYWPSVHRFDRHEKQDMKIRWASGNWSVAFIDDSPGGINRGEWLRLLLPKADYCIVHDYERDNEEAIAPMLKSIRFHHITSVYRPPTLIASMFKLIPESILCL